MPRKGRKGARLIVLPFEKQLTVGALASQTVIKDDLAQVLLDDVYAISADVYVAVANHTVNEGPIEVGLCHSDYSGAEVEEYLEVTDSWDFSNQTEQEKRRRKVRRIGFLDGAGITEKLNDGVKTRVPLKFPLQEGMTLGVWAFNKDSTVLTTGTLITFTGQIYCKKI